MHVESRKSHKEWRKAAKKERRRRIRTQQAKHRDGVVNTETTEYLNWLEEQRRLEEFQYEQIAKLNEEENKKWLESEEIAIHNWKILKEKEEQLHQLHLIREAKKKMECEIEQKRKKQEEEKLREMQEEIKKKNELFMSNLEHFLSGDSKEPPAELMVPRNTKPEASPCPFFSKTASCRFGDRCSRNHELPGISKVLLAANFFVHFGLNNANPSEYDTDVMLEYEDSDTYKEFTDFYKDVLPEFEKFGRVTQFKVCHNFEKHLRGNTYIEFAELRCAVAAYRSLHSRWYGGRQLSLQFCTISSWNSAICGLASRRRCPKGQSCNFLHVFRNPNNSFDYSTEQRRELMRRFLRQRFHPPTRNWRWSESPEREVRKKRRSVSTERKLDFENESPKTTRDSTSKRKRRSTEKH